MSTLFNLAPMALSPTEFARRAIARLEPTAARGWAFLRGGSLESFELPLPPEVSASWFTEPVARSFYAKRASAPEHISISAYGPGAVRAVPGEPKCILEFHTSDLHDRGAAMQNPELFLRKIIDGPLELVAALSDQRSERWRGWVEAGVPDSIRGCWLASFPDRAALAEEAKVPTDRVIAALETAWLEADDEPTPACADFSECVLLAGSTGRFGFARLPSGGLVLSTTPWGKLERAMQAIEDADRRAHGTADA